MTTNKNLQKIIRPTPRPIPVGRRITEQDIQNHLLDYTHRTGNGSLVLRNSTTQYQLNELGGCKKGYFEIASRKNL